MNVSTEKQPLDGLDTRTLFATPGAVRGQCESDRSACLVGIDLGITR